MGFQNNRLTVDNVPPLSQLNGKVRFTEHTAQVDRLSGQFLGGDVHANGGLKQDGTYALDLGGHIAVDAARGLNLHGPAAQVLTRMSGSAPYALNVRGAKGRLPEVTANSDLTGLALDFPAPFNKPVGTPMPLHFAVSPSASASEAGLERADLTFGPIAATYLLRYQPKTPPTVVSGAIGVNKPADLPSEGVIAAVDVEAFDADAWRALVTQMRNKDAPTPAPAAAAAPATPNPTARAIPAEPLRAARRHADAAQAALGQRDRRRVACGRQMAGQHRVEPGVGPRFLAAGRQQGIAGHAAGALCPCGDSLGHRQRPARPGHFGAGAEHAVDRSGGQ